MGRAVIFIVSLSCIFAILFELSMDSTSSFVRVTAASAAGDAPDNQSTPASHSASVVMPAYFEPILEGQVIATISWLIPRSPDAFVILRPPIA